MQCSVSLYMFISGWYVPFGQGIGSYLPSGHTYPGMQSNLIDVWTPLMQ